MSTLRLTTISNQDGSATVPSQTVISGSAKAWVNFNGTGTVAIRRSFNVSSITDVSTGNYTVNFTTAMPDINYAVVASASPDHPTATVEVSTTPTTTGQRVVTKQGTDNSSQDFNRVNVVVFS